MALNKSKRHLIFFALILLIVIFTTITLYFSLKTDPIKNILENEQIITILVILEENNTPLATAIIPYYPVSRRAAYIEIPGNTGAIYKTLDRVDRIDAVYREKGIDSYRAEIENLTGLTIHFPLIINLTDFQTLVDLLGGLRVFVPYPVDETIDDVRYLLPSGSVMLDGDKIVSYIKYTNVEEARIDQHERLQNTLIALFTAFTTNKNIFLNQKVFTRYAKYIQFAGNKDDLKNLLKEISKMNTERLFPKTITGSLRQVDGKQLLFPYYDGQLIKDVCKQTLTTLISDSEDEDDKIYVLEIQNGTTVQGLAHNTAALLRNAGYDVLSTINADKNDYEKTFIIDHIGNPKKAEKIAEFIRCKEIRTEKRTQENEATAVADFTIVLGKNFDGRYVR